MATHITEQPSVDSAEELEGLDSATGYGWGDYPLDAVFVRTEQRTVGEVVSRIEKSRYILDPDFQRDFVWPNAKQSKLIESCIMRIPLPVFYVAEAPDGRIIVVDGLQRLTTFARFLGGELKLTGLVSGEYAGSHQLEGKTYDRLPLNLQERVADTQLTMYILDAKAPERARLDIFERVNSGAVLTRQQMRNALYNGPATQWLKSASGEEPLASWSGIILGGRTILCSPRRRWGSILRVASSLEDLGGAVGRREPVRNIFRRGFAAAELPYFNPHSFRAMLVRHAMTLDLSPEAMKAWSQNLGHADVLTTFTSYGKVPTHRQGELVRSRSNEREGAFPASREQVAALQRFTCKYEQSVQLDEDERRPIALSITG